MIFQTLDDKKHCAGFYVDGQIFYDSVPRVGDLTGTWSPTIHVESPAVEYAQIYANGKQLGEVCPEHLSGEWARCSSKLQAFLRSFEQSGVSLDEHCFFDLVPEKHLLEFCSVKNSICEHVLSNYPRPKNYNFLVSVAKVLNRIEGRSLNINIENISKDLSNVTTRNFWKKIRGTEQRVRYNIFGTKTGRLSTMRNSFPIHTVGKDARKVIEPVNDFLVELDFNAAELRTLLALSGSEQPAEDIHEWNIKNIFGGDETRDEAKKKIFSWLYNPSRSNKKLESVYDRTAVVEKYFDKGEVNTFFGRTIPSDEKHALNYIIQSTTSDLLLSRLVAVDDILSGKESFVSFCIHDNLVLDLKAEECYLVPEIVETFSNTELGRYKVNMSVGRNFGEMKETSKWTQ